MKPGIPKGTRDFGPAEVRKRDFIFTQIREVFVQYGYQPIQTPAMENLSTLTGKYGDEGDKLLFKVLNNGDFLSKANAEALEARDSSKLISSIAKRGMRYDLTVPFARYVVMHQNDIVFPFKRYQIQPVWRADRPQKGRYQEFYQCDADVVGSNSLMLEAELMQIYDQAFARLGVPANIKINNRKVLYGMAEAAGIAEQFMAMTVAIDKLDKIGAGGVQNEMAQQGIPDAAISQILQMLETKELDRLANLLANSPTGMMGIEELRTVNRYLSSYTFSNELTFDPTLARGLSYYTGCIFEVAAIGVQMGSIGGGGRYDDLTSNFGLKNVSGVGISFGAARIFDVMEELQLFPEAIQEPLQVVLIAFDEASHRFAFEQLGKLRAAGINAELYPEPAKLKKQMKYANARSAPYAALVGTEEVAAEQLSLKNMESGEQEKLSVNQVIERLQAKT
ncbi:MAG: histidine--tRNA ligase [Bacteroidota bacterium]